MAFFDSGLLVEILIRLNDHNNAFAAIRPMTTKFFCRKPLFKRHLEGGTVHANGCERIANTSYAHPLTCEMGE